MDAPPAACRRLALEVKGAVQGVGFRPWVYRTARELELHGWVANDLRGLRVEVEGPGAAVERFLAELRGSPPPRAVVSGVAERWLEPTGARGFTIVESDGEGAVGAAVLPDLATCPACLAEVRDPADRRHRYPFTNCTDCGPRFTIIRDLPYDRRRTTMAGFRMCEACATEYADPLDRRFHAQPDACAVCGPRLAWWEAGAAEGRVPGGDAPDALDVPGAPGATGADVPGGDAALLLAAAAIREGRIVAVHGLGGFHLVCDAASDAAVRTLRARKRRPRKPMAVMVADLAAADRLCLLPAGAAELLSGPEAPIVLLPVRPDAPVAPSVAPGSTTLGVMLAYTPLHHLLLDAVGGPVVATSGNRSEEPICTSPAEAVERLAHVADAFLVHDRPIERHADDSVAWLVDGAPRLLRRARGYVPLPVPLAADVPPLLAAGAHLKAAVALARGREAWLGQHVGDLETPEARRAFGRVVEDLVRLYRVRPEALVHDLHPDYPSTELAAAALTAADPDGRPPRRIGVQHHHAHLASVLAEHGEPGPALGVIWDGTGYGTDGTIWGGEFLVGDAASFHRAARLRPFRLPGGEAAVREPRRSALALLRETFGPHAPRDLPPFRSFTDGEVKILDTMLERGVHAPVTSSAGRLLDGLASLVGLVHLSTHEGDAPMALEHAADRSADGAYPFELTGGDPAELDWRPAVAEAVVDVRCGVAAGVVSARFHRGLVRAMVAVAGTVGRETVALSGGCFQNRFLVEEGAAALRRAGFRVLLNRLVPPNDGGVALGQVAVAAALLQRE